MFGELVWPQQSLAPFLWTVCRLLISDLDDATPCFNCIQFQINSWTKMPSTNYCEVSHLYFCGQEKIALFPIYMNDYGAIMLLIYVVLKRTQFRVFFFRFQNQISQTQTMVCFLTKQQFFFQKMSVYTMF